MKRILITGKDSYIGTSFKKYMNEFSDEYYVEELDVRDDSWKEFDFSSFDVVFHVAGIAHIKETKKNQNLYYKVNRDLAIDIALKVKKDGVNQFVFLSSMSVYGMETGVIRKETIPSPKSHYGKSKLQAEERIYKLKTTEFKVCILRPPMVYGKYCKGNYQLLSKAARKLPIFPDIKNERSMIYIDNLTENVRRLINVCNDGVFLLQDSEYICTSQMVKYIASVHNNKIKMIKNLNFIINNIPISFVKKIFGNLTYEMDIQVQLINPVKTLECAIQLTEV